MAWRLPAEWEPQETVWFVWPRDETTWPGPHLDRARAAYRSAVEAVAANGDADLIVHPDVAAPDVEGVRIHHVEHVDSWIRDYGPLTLVDGEGARRMLDFRFDAWGGRYETLMRDDDVTRRLWPDARRIDQVLEGGAVETDGQGTFLATRSVAAARNQSEADHETLLSKHLGAKKVLWLDEGIQGDDTDGHIDTITRFVAPGTVVTAVAPVGHADHDALRRNREAFDTFTDARGRGLEVVDLPVPPRLTTDDGAVLPAGHANFLITNGTVLVPAYASKSDEDAIAALSLMFPSREVVGIDHRSLIWGFGGIHCLSMQIPC